MRASLPLPHGRARDCKECRAYYSERWTRVATLYSGQTGTQGN